MISVQCVPPCHTFSFPFFFGKLFVPVLSKLSMTNSGGQVIHDVPYVLTCDLRSDASEQFPAETADWKRWKQSVTAYYGPINSCITFLLFSATLL